LRRKALLAILCAASVFSIVSSAEPVRIAFLARVDNVYDPGDELHDAMHVGDLLQGTLTYDPAAPDVNPRPNVGRYEFRRAPSGFVVEAGQLIFQSDPNRTDMSVTLSNDEGDPPRDSFVVTSGNNLPLQNGASVTRISWQLADDTRTALTGVSLPAAAPDLRRWTSEFGLTIEGRGTVEYIIRAHVTEATLCTGSMRCPSPR
jgi:hypothetical protein